MIKIKSNTHLPCSPSIKTRFRRPVSSEKITGVAMSNYNLATSLPLIIILFMLPSFWTLAIAQNTKTIPVDSSVIATKTVSEAAWKSISGNFAFGFYPVDTGYSVGIWLITKTNTVVWTYDRDGDPFPDGTELKLTKDGLHLKSTAGDRDVSNITTDNINVGSAIMRNSGNFVIMSVNSEIKWQTFDHPTDTIFAGQLLRIGTKLVSSVSATKHSSGRFQMSMQQDGNLVMYPVNTPDTYANAYWSSNTERINTTTAVLTKYGDFTMSKYNNLTHNNTRVTPFLIFGRIDPNGVFRSFQVNTIIEEFLGFFSKSSKNICSIKGTCGLNSYCNSNANIRDSSTIVFEEEVSCLCLPGFVYNDESKPYMGCDRNFSMGLYSSAATEYEISYTMTNLSNISWLDDNYNNTGFDTEKECSDACLYDSNCYATLFTNQRCRKQRYPFLYATRKADDPTVAFIKVGSQEPQYLPPKKIIPWGPTDKVLILSVFVSSTSIFAITAAIFFVSVVINNRSSYHKKCRNMEIGLAGGMAPRYFTYRKLVEATNNFTNLIGKGGFATVFKGEVKMGDDKVMHIAVKRLDKLSWQNKKGFHTEMRTAGRAHHRNLVRLLGFCHEGSKFLLIYELMSQGSLANLIFIPKEARGMMNVNTSRPSWKKRIGMAMDVARGLLYLHEGCELTIVHGDIKPDNVLVAEDGTAKVGDLGLAKLLMSGLTKEYTTPKGTAFYQAPELAGGVIELATPKVDIYSYGILLLELITCKNYLQDKSVDGRYNLTEWAKKCLMESTLERLMPENEEEVDKMEIRKMVMVALWCVQKDPSTRKSMKEVVMMLGGKKSIPHPPDDCV